MAPCSRLTFVNGSSFSAWNLFPGGTSHVIAPRLPHEPGSVALSPAPMPVFVWSPLSDSNRRPPLYKSGALAN